MCLTSKLYIARFHPHNQQQEKGASVCTHPEIDPKKMWFLLGDDELLLKKMMMADKTIYQNVVELPGIVHNKTIFIYIYTHMTYRCAANQESCCCPVLRASAVVSLADVSLQAVLLSERTSTKASDASLCT